MQILRMQSTRLAAVVEAAAPRTCAARRPAAATASSTSSKTPHVDCRVGRCGRRRRGGLPLRMLASTCWTTLRIRSSVTCMMILDSTSSPARLQPARLFMRAEKIVLFSTLTVSTMPMMVASTGSFSVSGVRRALEPCTISTISPWPAPTVSTHDEGAAGADQPVAALRDRRAAARRSAACGRSCCDLLRRHHAAGDSGQEHGRHFTAAAIARLAATLCCACRATINLLIRRHDPQSARGCPPRAIGASPLAVCVLRPGRGGCRTSRGSRRPPRASRTEFSPMPPVKTMASAPSSSSR